jgi:hypothetical protein
MPDFVEVFLKWAPNGDSVQVQAWLEQRGLSTLRMKQGLLVTGTRSQIEEAFAVSLDNPRRPLELPVPDDLRSHVASLTVPKPRSYHS